MLWLGNYALYRACNHGISPSAKLQQLLRYLPASLVAVLPLAVTETCVLQSAVLKLWIVAELWAAAFPLTYHLTYRKISPDYDNQIDPAFAIYLFGILAGLSVLLPSLCVAPLLVLSLVAPLFLIGYYLLYHHVIDMNGMLLIRQTNYNEIIEFFRSSPLWKTLAGLVLLSGLVLAFVLIGQPLAVGAASLWSSALIVVLLGAVAHYLFKPRHSLFSRTGLAKLYLDVSEYARSNSRYVQNQQQRMEHLEARALHPLSAPPHLPAGHRRVGHTRVYERLCADGGGHNPLDARPQRGQRPLRPLPPRLQLRYPDRALAGESPHRLQPV